MFGKGAGSTESVETEDSQIFGQIARSLNWLQRFHQQSTVALAMSCTLIQTTMTFESR
jgi:hypothetical protein